MASWQPVLDATGPLVRSRWVFNCYLVPDGGDGSPLLIDVGLRSHAAAAASWLDAHHARVPVVAATHLHSDHVGGVASLCAACGIPDERVMFPERAASYYAGEVARSPGIRAVGAIRPVLLSQRFSAGSMIEQALAPPAGYGLRPFAAPVQRPTFLADGEPLGSAGDWTVLATPGHTDDSTVFYHRRERILASGDSVVSAAGRAWFNPEYVDATASGETEDRLRSLRVDILLPGHGRPVIGRDLLATATSFRDR